MSGKYCCECGEWCSAEEFSSNQWFKEYSKCPSCVRLVQFPIPCSLCSTRCTCRRVLEEHMDSCHPACDTCGRYFKNENNLRQHMKVHRSRKIACPVCGEQRFACSANAVAHVEMGGCSGCRGKAAARKRIHEFVSHNVPQLRVPMIENGYYADDVPEYPYYCHPCQRRFRHLSALMNHEEDYHKQSRNIMRLTY